MFMNEDKMRYLLAATRVIQTSTKFVLKKRPEGEALNPAGNLYSTPYLYLQALVSD